MKSYNLQLEMRLPRSREALQLGYLSSVEKVLMGVKLKTSAAA